jgi:hypothetical protein
MARSSMDQKKDDVLEVVFLGLLTAAILAGLCWFFARKWIVVIFAPWIYQLGKSWYLVPFVDTNQVLLELHGQGAELLSDPREASFGTWFSFVTTAITPINWLVCALMGFIVWRVATTSRPNFRRRMKPEQLAEYLSHIYTGTAPVLHLRRALADGTDKFWARQVFPHEVLLNHKIYGRPLVVEGKMDESRAQDYFYGLEKERKGGVLVPVMQGGRYKSTMLGNQVVDLMADAGKKGICFADRFSPAGKVIYALLTAYAYGGDEGRADYARYKDMLNNSCRGVPHGFANLSLAQDLYTKYRTNKLALNLFQVHHWEYTYLYALLIQAKRRGKCGHWEWLWLKPMSRILFYVLNTLGRFTPHTESAAAFAQFAYERKVSKLRRLPLLPSKDGKGFVHVIYVKKAVKGLQLAWDRWLEGDASDDVEWWNNRDIWREAQTVFDKLKAPEAPPSSLNVDTSFDKGMRGDEAAAAETRKKEEAAAMAAAQKPKTDDPFDFDV